MPFFCPSSSVLADLAVTTMCSLGLVALAALAVAVLPQLWRIETTFKLVQLVPLLSQLLLGQTSLPRGHFTPIQLMHPKSQQQWPM
jgi:hypothetical protein